MQLDHDCEYCACTNLTKASHLAATRMKKVKNLRVSHKRLQRAYEALLGRERGRTVQGYENVAIEPACRRALFHLRNGSSEEAQRVLEDALWKAPNAHGSTEEDLATTAAFAAGVPALKDVTKPYAEMIARTALAEVVAKAVSA